jgi:probable rRNA maturation factor
MYRITIHSLQKKLWLKKRTVLKRFLPLIFKSEKRRLDELSVIFCSDEYLLNINRKYLNHDTYTDIITFDLGNPLAVKGEIYISLERVKENAFLFNNTASQELLRVIFHGVLHLCGYNDKTPSEKRVMASKEDHYLNKYQTYVSRETRST